MDLYEKFKDKREELIEKYGEGLEIVVLGILGLLFMLFLVIYFQFIKHEDVTASAWIVYTILCGLMVCGIIVGLFICYMNGRGQSHNAKGVILTSKAYEKQFNQRKIQANKAHDKKNKLNKIQKEYVKRHKNIYEEYRWFCIGINVKLMPILLIAAVVLFVGLYKSYEDSIDTPKVELICVFIAISVLSMIYCIVKVFHKNTRKCLKEYITQHGFDEQDVNDDFMKGNRLIVCRALTCIGYKYFIYLQDDRQLVLRLRNIESAEIFTKYLSVDGAENTQKRIKLTLTDQGCYTFLVDEIRGELMLDDMGRHGIKVFKEMEAGRRD